MTVELPEHRACRQPHTPAVERGHPETWCHRCGGPNIVWCAPSPLWNAVMRGNDINGTDEHDGIVCPTCFAQLAEDRVGATGWRLSAGSTELALTTVTPSGRVWDAHAWQWRDPEWASPPG